MKNTVAKIIIIGAILMLSTSTLALTNNNPSQIKDQPFYLELTFDSSDFNQTKFYLLPSNTEYTNIEIINHNYIKGYINYFIITIQYTFKWQI